MTEKHNALTACIEIVLIQIINNIIVCDIDRCLVLHVSPHLELPTRVSLVGTNGVTPDTIPY